MRQSTLAPADVEILDGRRVTTPFATAWDLGRRLRLTEAVVAIDALARVGKFAPAALLYGPPGARGCRRLAEAVLLANPLSGSAMETRMRLALVLGGLPPPVLQYVEFDHFGSFVAQFDMAYPEVRLALEFDGAVHFEDKQSRRDRSRDLHAGDQGWLTMRFTSDDVFRRPQVMVVRVRRRIAERRALFGLLDGCCARQ